MGPRDLFRRPDTEPQISADPQAGHDDRSRRREHRQLLDWYFGQFDRIREAKSAKNFDEAVRLCAETVDALPAIVDAFRSDATDIFAPGPVPDSYTIVPPTIPPLEDLCHLAAARQDLDALHRAAQAVAARPDLHRHRRTVEQAFARAELSVRVLQTVTDVPGTVQSKLGKLLDVPGTETRIVAHWLNLTGQVARRKDGKQWRLYRPDDAPSQARPQADKPGSGPLVTGTGTQPRPIEAPTPPELAAIEGCQSGTFAAIDFETATGQRASACALAVTIVDDGRITDERSWLIRPPGNVYAPFNTFLHGIGPEHTADAPEFLDVMGEALELIDNRPVLAHYAAFDLGVLRESYLAAGVPWPSMQLGCTVVLSRRTWPGLPSYSLPVVVGFLGLGRFAHHDAAADSRMCAQLARAVMAHTGANTLDDAGAAVQVRFGRLEPELYEPCRALWRSISGQIDAPDPDNLDEGHPLYGKGVAFTGTLWSLTRNEAAQLVVDAGGRFTATPGKSTDYLVFGQQDFTKFVDGQRSAKTKRALQLIEQGHPLEVIEEAEFLRML